MIALSHASCASSGEATSMMHLAIELAAMPALAHLFMNQRHLPQTMRVRALIHRAVQFFSFTFCIAELAKSTRYRARPLRAGQISAVLHADAELVGNAGSGHGSEEEGRPGAHGPACPDASQHQLCLAHLCEQSCTQLNCVYCSRAQHDAIRSSTFALSS